MLLSEIRDQRPLGSSVGWIWVDGGKQRSGRFQPRLLARQIGRLGCANVPMYREIVTESNGAWLSTGRPPN
jgi:hypothetical protein